MSGLILKLAPNERVLINGAIIENGDKRTKITVKTPKAHILRLRDAIHPDHASTPVSRACYAAQLMLTGDSDPAPGQAALVSMIEQLSQVFDDRDSRRLLDQASCACLAGDMYRTLRHLRDLLPREARMLSATLQ